MILARKRGKGATRNPSSNVSCRPLHTSELVKQFLKWEKLPSATTHIIPRSIPMRLLPFFPKLQKFFLVVVTNPVKRLAQPSVST